MRLSPGNLEKHKGKCAKLAVRFTPLAVSPTARQALILMVRCPGVDQPESDRLDVFWAQQGRKKSLHSRKMFQATSHWQELIVPLPDNLSLLSRLTIRFNSTGNYEMQEISIRKPRWLEMHMTSSPFKGAKAFSVAGTCDVEATQIRLKLVGPNGKTHLRTIKPENDRFSYTWTNPPITLQEEHQLSAEIVGNDSPLAVSLPLSLFGYLDNYDFAWLKVDGPQIVSARDGKPFIPVGIGYARNVIIPAQDDAVMKFCRSHHLNTVRLAFYTARFNGDYSRPIDIDQHIADHIEPVVDAARRNGMYVILDDHEYFHERIDEAAARGKQNSRIWSAKTVDNWIESWKKVAAAYKDEPHVLGYELQNEPFGMEPEMVRDFYSRCIKAIREVDQKHIILVGTCVWSHARVLEKTWGAAAATIDAPYNNVVFAFHEYPKDDHPPIVQKHITEFRAKYQVPVLCTEFGATHWQHGATDCRLFISGMLGMFAKENVGWMIWALKTLEDNPRNPYNEIDKTGLGPPREFDSCPYSDMWPAVAEIMGTAFPKP
jgi:hypothetical protein